MVDIWFLHIKTNSVCLHKFLHQVSVAEPSEHERMKDKKKLNQVPL